MGIFGSAKKKKPSGQTAASQECASDQPNDAERSGREKYGRAWLMIVGQREKKRGLKLLRELDEAGFIEGTVALSMFCTDPVQRKALVKKAADAGNPEGLWEYSGLLPHTRIPDPGNAADALWEKTVLEAAERGSADAMNEMGNVFHRREHYAESMYWYAMANAYDHPDGKLSMLGIAKEWAQNGKPRAFVPGSPSYDNVRHQCAIAYLEIHANTEFEGDLHDIVKWVLDGVPIAGYLAGDLFEGAGDDETAYRMYNALSFENDAHALKCCADMLFAGKGTQQNLQDAAYMYLLAAEEGDRAAMFVAGELLKKSDRELAAYWYGVSHTRGYAPSLQRLIRLAHR